MHIGDKFPNLQGSTQDSDRFDLHKHIRGRWAVVFAHPGDFTPVCTTELAAAAEMQYEFSNRGVLLVGFSVDSAEQHRRWIRDIEYVSGHRVEFPLFADESRENAKRLGILDRNGLCSSKDGLPLTVRGTFVIRPDQTIAAMMIYPHNVGRNLDELLRLIDSLLLTEREKEEAVVTPSGWNKGDDVLVSYNLDDDEAKLKFGEDGFRIVNVPSENGDGGGGEEGVKKHYLRYCTNNGSGC